MVQADRKNIFEKQIKIEMFPNSKSEISSLQKVIKMSSPTIKEN